MYKLITQLIITKRVHVFYRLTVAEHLEFFCLLKGMEKHLVDPEINRLLAALGLGSKRHAKSRTLSGGMKRKLCVLIALCGGSKVLPVIIQFFLHALIFISHQFFLTDRTCSTSDD